MEIKKVGILGVTGTMGRGIAQICAQAGYQVTASSRSEDRLSKALASIDSTLARGVERGRLSQEDKDAAMSKIKGTTNISDFNDSDLVVEVAAEDLEIKKQTFAELDKICPAGAILATNTSVLSVTEIAAATGRPDKIVGLHFFNPPPAMKLVEIIRTKTASEDTIETSRKFAESVDKTPVIVSDTSGFIVNRLAVPFMLNAMHMLDSGVASPEDIDTAVTLGLNHPMGPLALADLIGNDIILSMADGIHKILKEDRYIAPPLLKKMVADGQLGRKSGKGFYDYSK
ncbi:MAG: 3-hydroxyacyl-CoA dehydrogenase family protein [Dehalococcoidales bacterium]|nr:3-hydroxybutyryl-CoA dehydrogenase [Dehalococcoidales bacterium]MDP6501476.1 3-hydroxyacyl-CoA dehydrogenase family protein [Dehalococcoidales bacterium]